MISYAILFTLAAQAVFAVPFPQNEEPIALVGLACDAQETMNDSIEKDCK
jgi:hypothetical protein